MINPVVINWMWVNRCVQFLRPHDPQGKSELGMRSPTKAEWIYASTVASLMMSLRTKFMEQVANQIPEKYEPKMEFYDG